MKSLNILFLVSSTLALLSSAQLTPAVRENHGRYQKRNPESLVPSDHGVELNRDFTNMIQYGLVEGMFKVKKSGLPDCTEEGMTIFRASQRMALKMNTEEFREDDYLNLF